MLSPTVSAAVPACTRRLHRTRHHRILIDRFIPIPLWGCPATLTSNNGLQRCPELSRAIYERLGINKIATRSYHPGTDGGIDYAKHTISQMLAMAVNEQLTGRDVLLPHVKSTYINSVITATGFAANEVHMRWPLS